MGKTQRVVSLRSGTSLIWPIEAIATRDIRLKQSTREMYNTGRQRQQAKTSGLLLKKIQGGRA